MGDQPHSVFAGGRLFRTCVLVIAALGGGAARIQEGLCGLGLGNVAAPNFAGLAPRLRRARVDVASLDTLHLRDHEHPRREPGAARSRWLG